MFEKEIARGIELLNKINPGWTNKVNLKVLDLSSGINCLISQLYELNYSDAIQIILSNQDIEDDKDIDYGFYSENGPYEVLTQEWKDTIISIRSNQSTSILDTKPENHNKLYTKDSVKDLLSKVMELGMTARENQLNCSELRSGREVLEEFIKNNL